MAFDDVRCALCQLSGVAVAVTHLALLAYVRKKYKKTALDKAHFDEF